MDSLEIEEIGPFVPVVSVDIVDQIREASGLCQLDGLLAIIVLDLGVNEILFDELLNDIQVTADARQMQKRLTIVVDLLRIDTVSNEKSSDVRISFVDSL